ncbi:hypothetical protein [Flavobacterium sp. UBA6031]|uniref:hypothetical protein n=1 Tax=Flavobacterium sp. UBA6031 TaxID=1946551 RepID=UPI0025C33F39|nr:hypothetical protein [Flavobacterium sp. UBA6031]
MRNVFSELEFQFALMMGYYTLFSKQDSLNLYLPTASEEKHLYASDWFYESARGVNLYLQFKKSEEAIPLRKTQRKDYFNNLRNNDPSRDFLFEKDRLGVFEFKVYKTNNTHQQHNLLFNNNRLNNSLALYVAPIFTSRFELQSNLKEWIKGKNFSSKIIYKMFNGEQRETIQLNRFEEDFAFFQDVIYIEPHAEINNEVNHHYCFNRKREVSFHSEILPLKRSGLGFIDVVREIRSKLEKEKTSTILETADKNLQELITYFIKNDISLIRDYKLEKLFETAIKDSTSILHQLDSFKEKKEYGKYVYIINKLYQEIFDIQVAFIYPRI